MDIINYVVLISDIRRKYNSILSEIIKPITKGKYYGLVIEKVEK